MGGLPLIDLSASDQAIADELGQVYRDVGFAGVVNHGIERSLLDAVFEASREFHELDQEKKLAIELNEHHRGYIARGASTDTGSEYEQVTAPNQSESFMMLGPVAAGRFLSGSNQWPDLSGFRSVLEEYHRVASQLAERLIGCFAIVVGHPLQPMFEMPTAWLRLLRYPAQSAESSDYGSAPHRDYGAITLLAQQDIPGLEVLTAGGDWIEAGADPDVLILNTGEVIHRWSNGTLLRTPHRVRNRSGRNRYSIPFFYDPDMRSTIEPLARCVPTGERAAFEPVSFEELVRNELRAGYTQHRGQPKASSQRSQPRNGCR